MPKPFLTAEWRKLAVVNYVVDPVVLLPYVPLNTSLEFWNKRCYVSLVGFMFYNTRIKGLKIPFHVNFEEINLRFYVQRNDRKGVVFIREIVSKPAVSFIANLFFHENYKTLPTAYSHIVTPGNLNIEYRWKGKDWNALRIATEKSPRAIEAGSEEDYILEHYWGYKKHKTTTVEYLIEHPRWEVYPVRSYHVDVDFGDVYGPDFAFLTNEKPVSVYLVEGSEVVVKEGIKIQ